MGEFGRTGPQLPHEEAAQREHFKEVDEDLRHDREADRVAKGHVTRPRWRLGYLVVLAGAAGFVVSCFLPYYDLTVLSGDPRTVSLYQQLASGGANEGGSDVGALLLLFGGIASVALVAALGVARSGPALAPRASSPRSPPGRSRGSA